MSIESDVADVIFFYSKEHMYGEFSNFFRCDFYLDNKRWMTVEHFFQAAKFAGDECYMEKIRLASSPKIARQLGQTRSICIAKGWDDNKERVMRRALHAKFTSCQNLKVLLLGTGAKLLVEASPYDYYWGCGSDGSGRNRLGCLLMELRDELLKGE